MTNTDMTPDQEYEIYAQPENQEPQGSPIRRRGRMSVPIPVRLPPELLERVRKAAEDDDRHGALHAGPTQTAPLPIWSRRTNDPWHQPASDLTPQRSGPLDRRP